MLDVYNAILGYIDAHMDENITIDDLQAATGYSRRHLYRLFGRYSDTSIMEYIRRKKLSAAAVRMRDCESIFEIALDYGYETSAGFYKAFYTVYGCSPSNYKNKQMRGKSMENARNVEELTDLISREPENAALYIERAEYYQSQSMFKESIADCEKAISLGGGAEAYRALGWVYIMLDISDKAFECYTKSIELEPQCAEAYNQRASIYKWRGDNDNALADYNKAIELAPKSADYYLYRGRFYHSIGETEKSAADFEKSVEVAEDKARALCQRGLFYSSMEWHEEALCDLDRAIELAPEKAWLYNNRGNIHLNHHNPREALEDFDKTIELEPDKWNFYINRARCLRVLGQQERMEADLKKAIEISTEQSDAFGFRRLGDVCFELRRYDDAIKCFCRAAELNPRDKYVYQRWAGLYSATGNYEKAIEYYNKALELSSGEGWLYAACAQMYMKLGRYDEAIQYFEKQLELIPDNNYICNELAEAYQRTKQYDKALEKYADLAARIEKQNGDGFISESHTRNTYAWTFTHRGGIYEEMGDYDKAAEFYLKGIERDPDNAWHYYNLVNLCAYKISDNRDKVMEYCGIAKKYYDRALGLYDQNFGIDMGVRDEREWQTRIYRFRAACFEAMGMPDEAEADYEKSTELERDKTYVNRFRISRCLKAKQYDKAAQLAKKALAQIKDAGESPVTRAYEYLIAMQPDKAIAELKGVKESDDCHRAASELLEALSG